MYVVLFYFFRPLSIYILFLLCILAIEFIRVALSKIKSCQDEDRVYYLLTSTGYGITPNNGVVESTN